MSGRIGRVDFLTRTWQIFGGFYLCIIFFCGSKRLFGDRSLEFSGLDKGIEIPDFFTDHYYYKAQKSDSSCERAMGSGLIVRRA